MGKWFGQASEIEELRAENQRLKEQVANLEARLRAAYADAGVTALSSPVSPAPEAAVPQAPVPAFPAGAPTPATASSPEVSAAELQMIAEGRTLYAVKAYRDRDRRRPLSDSLVLGEPPALIGCRPHIHPQ